eukprot:CAMPEP_0184342990 /NCGR_PEP_ID=MMETSP1089-20130417/11545_1 /TAXON_ID=38269 ORGANISM="Gloeochaete wittrockiana, Strain SAG46.84" /NCGR_SAMPLE_ID=MMETSP1089 /ASSEMBLY_ACC=CAM_ASM_000445 /LENGTH=551 /DNA_ID=CAMNT_0026672097 /DNA_START=113 /DNA_END=1769 /DNA_ORIENTATION=-
MVNTYEFTQRTVLVVDDDSFTRHVLQRLFEKFTSKVSGATCGRHALEMLKRTQYDILLIDISMPDLTGFQVLQLERENERLKQTAVIMMSSYVDLETVVNSFRIGADDFLPKPISFVELKRRAGANLLCKQYRRQERIALNVERKFLTRPMQGSCAHNTSTSNIRRKLVEIDVDTYLSFQKQCAIADAQLPDGFPVVVEDAFERNRGVSSSSSISVNNNHTNNNNDEDESMETEGGVGEDSIMFNGNFIQTLWNAVPVSNFFDLLPDDVLARVFILLDKDVLRAACVCRRWRRICHDDVVWDLLWTSVSTSELWSWSAVPHKYRQRVINYSSFADLMDGPDLPDDNCFDWETACRARFPRSWCNTKQVQQSWRQVYLKLLVSIPSRRRDQNTPCKVVVIAPDGQLSQKEVGLYLPQRPFEVESPEYVALLRSLRPHIPNDLDLDVTFFERPDLTVVALYSAVRLHLRSGAGTGADAGGFALDPASVASSLPFPLNPCINRILDAELVGGAFGHVVFILCDDHFPLDYLIEDFAADCLSFATTERDFRTFRN